MILVDYNQILMQSMSAGSKQFGDDLTPFMIRNIFLNMVFSYEKKYGKQYGDMVICCDGSKNWRKDEYVYYKAKRAEGRASQPLDWEMIFQTLNDLRNEINDYFPWKMVIHDKAEGDDVIAVLVKYFSENELVQEGLFVEPQPILIISSDTDFIQLQEYKNVKQFSPLQRKMLSAPSARRYRFEKIARGDAGDGVPNMLSDDDTFVVDGKRQKPMHKERCEAIVEAQMKGNPVEYNNKDEEIAHDRNKRMIDLVDYSMPAHVAEEIVEMYKDAPVHGKSKLLNYFVKHRMNNLARNIM